MSNGEIQNISNKIWEEEIKPLILKRNAILDSHNNSMEAFELPEIKAIDAEIDKLEMELHEIRRRADLFAFALKVIRHGRDLRKKREQRT